MQGAAALQFCNAKLDHSHTSMFYVKIILIFTGRIISAPYVQISNNAKGGHKALHYIKYCILRMNKKETAHFRVRYMLALSIYPG